MKRYRFTLNLSPEQCLQYYCGGASRILARSDEGVQLAFPAAELRRFMSRDGVHGRFEIAFGDVCQSVSASTAAYERKSAAASVSKLISLERITDASR